MATKRILSAGSEDTTIKFIPKKKNSKETKNYLKVEAVLFG